MGNGELERKLNKKKFERDLELAADQYLDPEIIDYLLNLNDQRIINTMAKNPGFLPDVYDKIRARVAIEDNILTMIYLAENPSISVELATELIQHTWRAENNPVIIKACAGNNLDAIRKIIASNKLGIEGYNNLVDNPATSNDVFRKMCEKVYEDFLLMEREDEYNFQKILKHPNFNDDDEIIFVLASCDYQAVKRAPRA